MIPELVGEHPKLFRAPKLRGPASARIQNRVRMVEADSVNGFAFMLRSNGNRKFEIVGRRRDGYSERALDERQIFSNHMRAFRNRDGVVKQSRLGGSRSASRAKPTTRRARESRAIIADLINPWKSKA